MNFNDADVPTPPPHRYSQTVRNNSSITPGVDNLGPSSVGGGISGIALGVANSHDRLSGVNAMRDLDHDTYAGPAERGYNTTGSDNPYVPDAADYGGADSLGLVPEHSYGSSMALGTAAALPGSRTPGQSSTQLSGDAVNTRSMIDQYPGRYGGGGAGVGDFVGDGPYQRQSHYSSGTMPVDINPDDIADDGDDEFAPAQRNQMTGGVPVASGAAGAAGSAAAGGFLGGIFSRGKSADVSYGPVPGGGLEAGKGERETILGDSMPARKKRGLIVGIVLGLIILGAIVGGAVGGTIGSRGKDASSSDGNASDDTSVHGDLNKDSSEIKALMGNKNLHKVFPGVDYTPWGVQYPLCLKYPPSQNNVTRDMAVLSQLTNTVRLYGTDCNQTEMVLHAIDQLELTEIKVWLGVWIDSNKTTTKRQLAQLYDILDDTKHTPLFKGVIVGNEALYRAGSDKQSAEKTVIEYIKEVRSEVDKRKLDMSVATSDLGDNWNAQLVDVVDVVMSNVHPFFAGVNVDVAASWTWDFWQTHDVSLTKNTDKKQVISEVGWPSGGGKDCGDSPVCDSDTPGSIASIDNMNKFMSDWVCQALENGTDYFWLVLGVVLLVWNNN